MAFRDLKYLAANRGDFRNFCAICEHLEKRWGDHKWTVEEAHFSAHFRSSQVDKISRHIIPSKYEDLVPICSTGDGNCLFNSASLAICQNESRAIELRLRTCFELAKNRDFYKTHPVLVNSRIPYHSGRNVPGIMSVETLCDLTCFDASSSCEFGKKGFDAAFENEITRTSLNYSYSGTLQIMALASVLGVPIQTVYPDQNHKLLPVYENVFQPREGRHSSNNVFVRILWTNTQGWPDRSKEFTVNHFVPLFKRGDEVFKPQNTARKLAKETNYGHVFVQTKQSKQPTDRKAFEKRNGKKITENAKQNRTESQSDDISGKNKGVKHAKGKRESIPDRKDSPDKLGKKNQSTEQNEGNGNIKNREGRRTTAQQGDRKAQQRKENFNNKTRMKCSQQQLKTEKSKKKDEVNKTQTPGNQGKSEKQPPRVQEEERDRPKNTEEQKSEEKSKEKPTVVQEEERDRPKNTEEQKNEEKSKEKPAVVQEEKRDRPKNTEEQKNEEKSKEKPSVVQEEKRDRPNNTEEQQNEEKSKEKPTVVQDEERQNDQSNGQETFKPQRTSKLNGKKRKHATLFDMNDPKSDSCSSAKKTIHTPSEAAIKFVQDRSALPFPCASRSFYRRQNKKAIQNAKRTKRRQELPVLHEDSKLIGLQRSTVEGSLQQNIESIKKEVTSCTNKTRHAELWAVIDVAMELQKSILLETSTAAAIYKKRKASLTNKEESFYFRPIDTYEKLSKHINIAQIYIDQKAFIVEAKDTDIRKVVEIVSNTLEKLSKHTAKEKVHTCLKDNFRDVLGYLDSKRDRDVLEAVIAKIASVKTVVSIKGTKFKGSISKHRGTLDTTIKSFKEINQSCQTVRSDMTVSQQHAKFQREKEKIKNEQLKVVAEGRGRKLKCEEFPELARYLEFAFGEGDRVLRGGGGLQADPRLLDSTLFKAADNATVMRHAKEMLRKIKPDFKISTSCLYTYTMNYRKGTKQAERHHHGKGVNANISLHKPPNTSQNIYPINSHWSTSHVNYLMDSAAENANGFLLDSKDAKCIVCGDIAPVLKPGKSWSNFETPDHSFDQSRVNAVTPMTHLFMDMSNIDLIIPDTETVVNVTRSGKAVTLINLSLTEPETVFRVFNEIMYLMTIPSLDKFFRNPETGRLKEIMGFIVDNGPSEAPASFLVQMLLVRLLKFLDLDKVTQRSFAEYLSKRNPVERVHAAENNALSSHGPFSSKMIHKNASPGSKQHKENMESMAREVIQCIGTGMYNKEAIKCFRGIGSEEKFIFTDEKGLKSFGLLSDERKEEDESKYRPINNDILAYLENVWAVKKNFIGSYSEDYRTLKCNKTACTDKYSTSVFRENESWRGQMLERFDRQPLPDYKRWEDSGELHYQSYETRRDFSSGPWDECPGLFLPDKVLDTCFRANPVPSPESLKAIAFIAWVSVEETAQYFDNARKQLTEQRVDDLKRESWKLHPLYKESRATLLNKCAEANLISSGKKYDLVQRIVESQGKADESKLLTEADLYDGKISTIPNSTAGLLKLSVAHLRAMLRRHNILEVGTKDELIARVGLLKAGHPEAAFSRERLCILHYITVAKQIYRNQEEMSSIRRSRTFAYGKEETLTTRNSCLRDMMKSKTPTIEISNSERNLYSILIPLENEVAQQEEKARANIDELERKTAKKPESVKAKVQTSGKGNDTESTRRSDRKRKQPAKLLESANSPNHLAHVGTVVDVLWTEEELEGTNWKPGWYRGEVQQYDEDDDLLYILYFKDRAVFSLNATGAFSDGIIRAVS